MSKKRKQTILNSGIYEVGIHSLLHSSAPSLIENSHVITKPEVEIAPDLLHDLQSLIQEEGQVIVHCISAAAAEYDHYIRVWPTTDTSWRRPMRGFPSASFRGSVAVHTPTVDEGYPQQTPSRFAP